MVNEQSTHKFWWLAPNGKLHQVPFYGHSDWALEYLKNKGFDVNERNVYGNMLKLGWARVSLFTYNGKRAIEYDANKNKPLTPRQMKQLKDTAIEEDVQEITPNYCDV